MSGQNQSGENQKKNKKSQENPQEKLKSNDPLFILKYLGYCLSQSPTRIGEMTDFADFVRFAKFQLCHQKKLLTKDPIWEQYTPEEIIVEYYANLMESDPKTLQEFEALIVKSKEDPEDDIAWMNRKMEELQKEKVEDEDGEFEVTPEILGK